jgi:hypothetical protein
LISLKLIVNKSLYFGSSLLFFASSIPNLNILLFTFISLPISAFHFWFPFAAIDGTDNRINSLMFPFLSSPPFSTSFFPPKAAHFASWTSDRLLPFPPHFPFSAAPIPHSFSFPFLQPPPFSRHKIGSMGPAGRHICVPPAILGGIVVATENCENLSFGSKPRAAVGQKANGPPLISSFPPLYSTLPAKLAILVPKEGIE